MKYLLKLLMNVFLYAIGYSWMIIVNPLVMLWHFEINPVINQGIRDKIDYKVYYDIKLWDEFLGVKHNPY